MKYTVKAEKLEMTLQVDEGFVEALLGAIRAAKAVYPPKVYTPYPEESEFDFSPESEGMPEAAPPEPPAPVELDRTSKAYRKWYAFVLTWLSNFDQEGDQPDRQQETRSLSVQREAGQVVTLIRQQGGLTHAVHEAIESAFAVQESSRLDGMTESDRKLLARQVAENITQVSSLFFYDLCDLLEYHNPLEEEED